jgi:hypothetical protein
VKKTSTLQSRPRLYAAAGVLTLLLAVAGARPAMAQASDAADKCTGDVMRLCSEFVPDADRIVVCLKAKRRQLSAACRTALSSGSGGGSASKASHRRHSRKKSR